MLTRVLFPFLYLLSHFYAYEANRTTISSPDEASTFFGDCLQFITPYWLAVSDSLPIHFIDFTSIL